MRIDRLTSTLQVALSDAQSMAVGRDHNQIDPLHLMLALMEQQHGTIRPLLLQMGVDLISLRQQLSEAMKQLPTISNPPGDINLFQELARLLNKADAMAHKRGDQFISGKL